MQNKLHDEKNALIILDMQASSKWLAEHFFRNVAPASYKQILVNNQKIADEFVGKNIPIYIVTTRMFF